MPSHVLITETHNKQVKFAFNVETGTNYNTITVIIDYVIAFGKSEIYGSYGKFLYIYSFLTFF